MSLGHDIDVIVFLTSSKFNDFLYLGLMFIAVIVRNSDFAFCAESWRRLCVTRFRSLLSRRVQVCVRVLHY